MKLFKYGLLMVSGLTILWGTLSAGDNELIIYKILAKDSGKGRVISYKDRKYRVIPVDKAKHIQSPHINSIDNVNSYYGLDFEISKKPEKDFKGLVIRLGDVYLKSIGYSVSGGMVDSVSFLVDSRDKAKRFARALGVRLQDRYHPGHQLLSRFIPDKKKGSSRVTFEIKNVGNKAIRFLSGGMNRGYRDNQFSFVGFRDSKSLVDRGSSIHFGGRGIYVTLKKNELFKKEVDLTKWFDTKEKGYYEFIGSYYMQFYEPKKAKDRSRIIWVDYVTSRFYFRVR
ncbi:MAG: hypothetical protein OEZ36_13965 [Spirochaetota bacterium]|nr:hypothetical protein [Spirochaetota bacterium]